MGASVRPRKLLPWWVIQHETKMPSKEVLNNRPSLTLSYNNYEIKMVTDSLKLQIKKIKCISK